MISQQVVYVLAQAMADTNTVAIVRYVKKDDADPQVMVLRPNPSCVDATLYMYRIPFRVRYSISLFIHSFIHLLLFLPHSFNMSLRRAAATVVYIHRKIRINLYSHRLMIVQMLQIYLEARGQPYLLSSTR